MPIQYNLNGERRTPHDDRHTTLIKAGMIGAVAYLGWGIQVGLVLICR